jgi:hypothetical protein
LEALLAEQGVAGPLTLCPSTTDPAVAEQWLGWTAAGVHTDVDIQQVPLFGEGSVAPP